MSQSNNLNQSKTQNNSVDRMSFYEYVPKELIEPNQDKISNGSYYDKSFVGNENEMPEINVDFKPKSLNTKKLDVIPDPRINEVWDTLKKEKDRLSNPHRSFFPSKRNQISPLDVSATSRDHKKKKKKAHGLLDDGLNEDKKWNNNDKVFLSAVQHRKIFRIVILFLLIGIIGTITYFSAFNFILITGTFSSPANIDLTLLIQDCSVFIYDLGGSDGDPIQMSFKVPRNFLINSASRAEYLIVGTSRQYTFVNEFPASDCNVKIYVRKNTTFNSLKFECLTSCKIIQDSDQLQITSNTIITGQEIHANFKDLSTSQITHSAKHGHLQLNHIIITSSLESSLELSLRGDIIIQTTDSFQISAKSTSQSFCFVSPSTTLQSVSNCSISGNTTSYENKNSTSCEATYNLCSTPSCTPSRFFKVNATDGSIYANIIPSQGSTVTGKSIAKGSIFDSGISFSATLLNNITNFLSLMANPKINTPMMILNLGDDYTRSVYYSKFVISSNPSYSYVKPWWISTFSGTVLAATEVLLRDRLLPGFCPYYGTYTVDQYYQVQKKLQDLTGGTTLTTFVIDRSDGEPPTSPLGSSGIMKLTRTRNPVTDYWYSVGLSENGLYGLTDNNIDQSSSALGAIILSLMVSVYGSYLIMNIVIYGLNMMYFKVVEQTEHLKDYIRLQNYKDSKAKKALLEDVKKKKMQYITKYNLWTVLKKSPSISAYLDFLSHMLFWQQSNSAKTFYDLLFEKVSIKGDDLEELDPNKDMITGEELKILYERFCFVNHYAEQKLTENVYKKYLKHKGFSIVEDSSTTTTVFMKINIKNYEDFAIELDNDEKGDSLDIYFKYNVQITAFEDDQIEVQTFMKIYNSFCDYNRLKRIMINPSLIQERYDINFKEISTQILCRISEPESGKKYNRFDGPTRWIINKNKLIDNIALKMDKINSIPPDRIQKAIRTDLKFRFWWLWDLVIVTIHIGFGLIMTLPLFFIALLIETEYTPFAIKDPEVLVVWSELIRDPANLILKVYNGFGWSTAIIIVIAIQFSLHFADLLIYYL